MPSSISADAPSTLEGSRASHTDPPNAQVYMREAGHFALADEGHLTTNLTSEILVSQNRKGSPQMNASNTPISARNLTVPTAILWGGLIAGVLDATDGVIAYGFQGLNPIQVLQYIASGVLGPGSFKGGLVTAALGTVLHFFIAFVAAAAYVMASRRITALKSQPIPFGLLYGVAVYFFMNSFVLKFSAVTPSPFSLVMFLTGVIGHALFVGLPIAWYAKKTAN